MSNMRVFFHPDRDSLDLASVLHALSDPVRLRIVQSLAQSGELTCGAFGIDAPKSTLSHHFKVLREGGVIRTRMEGVHRIVSLRMEDLNSRFPGLIQAVLKALTLDDVADHRSTSASPSTSGVRSPSD